MLEVGGTLVIHFQNSTHEKTEFWRGVACMQQVIAEPQLSAG